MLVTSLSCHRDVSANCLVNSPFQESATRVYHPQNSCAGTATSTSPILTTHASPTPSTQASRTGGSQAVSPRTTSVTRQLKTSTVQVSQATSTAASVVHTTVIHQPTPSSSTSPYLWMGMVTTCLITAIFGLSYRVYKQSQGKIMQSGEDAESTPMLQVMALDLEPGENSCDMLDCSSEIR